MKARPLTKREKVLMLARQLFGQFLPPELEELLEAMPDENSSIEEIQGFQIKALTKALEAHNALLNVLDTNLESEIKRRANVTNNLLERVEDLERWKIADIDSPSKAFVEVGNFIHDNGVIRPSIVIRASDRVEINVGTPIYIKTSS